MATRSYCMRLSQQVSQTTAVASLCREIHCGDSVVVHVVEQACRESRTIVSVLGSA